MINANKEKRYHEFLDKVFNCKTIDEAMIVIKKYTKLIDIKKE